jgi:hypothetical protein
MQSPDAPSHESDTLPESSVIPYARFLERQAWRAKIAADFRALDMGAVDGVIDIAVDTTHEVRSEAEAVATCER